MKSTAVVSLVLISTLGLVGCSGDDQEPAVSSASSGSDSSAGSPTPDPGIISPDLVAPPAFNVEPQGAIDDVQVASCDTEPGTVTAAGTATNSGKFGRDIVIIINWAVTGTNDVVARGIAQVENLEPGASAEWSLEAELDSDQPVSCVPTALAGQLTE